MYENGREGSLVLIYWLYCPDSGKKCFNDYNFFTDYVPIPCGLPHIKAVCFLFDKKNDGTNNLSQINCDFKAILKNTRQY